MSGGPETPHPSAPVPDRTETSVWPASTPDPSERQLLQGPHARRHELRQAVRIFAECIRGFRTLHFVGPCVTVFGSARFDATHPYYALGEEIGAKLAEIGITVMTGGGPGLMEAANRGARMAGGRSIGCNIQLPHEQQPNPYLDATLVEVPVLLRSQADAAVRQAQQVGACYSYAFVGPAGRLRDARLEIFETRSCSSRQARWKRFPLVLLGVDFWKPLVDVLRQRLLPAGTIDDADVALITVTDSPAEAVALVRETAMRDFGLTYGPRARKRWYLGE